MAHDGACWWLFTVVLLWWWLLSVSVFFFFPATFYYLCSFPLFFSFCSLAMLLVAQGAGSDGEEEQRWFAVRNGGSCCNVMGVLPLFLLPLFFCFFLSLLLLCFYSSSFLSPVFSLSGLFFLSVSPFLLPTYALPCFLLVPSFSFSFLQFVHSFLSVFDLFLFLSFFPQFVFLLR